MDILGELRRRKVFRVAGVYAVVGWLLAQAAALIEGAIGLPSWFDGVVVSLLFLGLPVAVVLAWALEMTPDGLRLTAPATQGAPASEKTLAGLDIALLAALVVLIGVSAVQAFRGPDAANEPVGEIASAPPAPETLVADARPSIAVLPFVNMSSDQEQDYFSDGLSEELLNQLANIEGLRVIARTSSFAFKGDSADARSIGGALGVTTLLEGSVRKSGDRLRITAQLIDVADGAHLWSRTYDRQLEDVFAVQEEIAGQVAEALSVTLGVASETRTLGTDDIEAYDHALRGRALRAQGIFTAGDAITEFQRAVDIDPEYGLAWALMSDSFGMLAVLEPGRVEELREQSEAASERGMQVAPNDPTVQEIYASMLVARRDWMGWELARRRAIASGDNAAISAFENSNVLGTLGLARQAVAFQEQVRAKDPLNGFMAGWTAWAYDLTGQADAALAEHQRAERLPGYLESFSYNHLVRLMHRGDADAVRAFLPKAVYSPDGAGALLQRIFAVWDDREQALPLVRSALTDPDIPGPARIGAMSFLAGYYGDTELALEMLRVEFFERGSIYPVYLWHPTLAEARRTEGFKDIVRDLGLVDFWRETGEWNDFCRPVGEDDFECI